MAHMYFVLCCLTVGLAGSASAQTVLDMYLDIPSKMLGQLEGPDEKVEKTKEEMLALLTVKDIKNGFLKTKGGVHIAKFNRKKGSPLLAVAGGSYAEDGRDISLQLFAKDEKGNWQDQTSDYMQQMPELVIDALYKQKCKVTHRLTDSASGTYRYNLPQKGRTILAVVESDIPPTCKPALFTLAFDGVRFEMGL